jgi:hypothetical protein
MFLLGFGIGVTPFSNCHLNNIKSVPQISPKIFRKEQGICEELLILHG